MEIKFLPLRVIVEKTGLSLFIVLGFILVLFVSSCSSLEMAVINSNFGKAKSLIEKGADVNKGGTKMTTPLTNAACYKDTAMVHLLLINGADINKPTSGGKTPIYWAVYQKDSVMVRYLIRKGADVNIPNSKGEKPLALAQKNGQIGIANMLKNDSVIRQTTELSSVSNESKTVVNVNNANTKQKNKKFFWSLRLIKPIPAWIWATAISEIRTPSNFKSEYGKITDWGYGTGVEMHLENGIRLFCDLTTYKYKLEIAEKGETVRPTIGTGVTTITLSDGAKYSNNTVSLRLGAKYNFLRDKACQPWIGVAYGMNVWHVKYLTWDEKKTYGTANGIQWRPAILAGIDFKTKDMGTYTFFFEAIGTTAEYTMKNLFGLGDYDTHGASAEMGYPTPRIGISCTF
jgi:hypothetical protein